MQTYLQVAHELIKQFQQVKFAHVSRGENSAVDALARLASSIGTDLVVNVPIEILEKSSMEKAQPINTA